MSFRVKCYTLFDITQTGVMNRNRPAPDDDMSAWTLKRNTQCNFDTILQAVSLRSQPEDITMPEKSLINFNEFDCFGFLFENDNPVPCWSFEFSISHPSVFDNGISELGNLYTDCDNVPMIKTNTCWEKLPSFLDGTDELRNIYFKVIRNG